MNIPKTKPPHTVDSLVSFQNFLVLMEQNIYLHIRFFFFFLNKKGIRLYIGSHNFLFSFSIAWISSMTLGIAPLMDIQVASIISFL